MTDIQNKNYIIALDQGTTSSRAIIFDRDANVVCTAQREFTQHYPQAGWVEHDPMEIFRHPERGDGRGPGTSRPAP